VLGTGFKGYQSHKKGKCYVGTYLSVFGVSDSKSHKTIRATLPKGPHTKRATYQKSHVPKEPHTRRATSERVTLPKEPHTIRDTTHNMYLHMLGIGILLSVEDLLFRFNSKFNLSVVVLILIVTFQGAILSIFKYAILKFKDFIDKSRNTVSE